MNVKKVLTDNLSKIENDEVALFLSGGSGSIALLFSLLELNKNVTAYTFHLKGHESTDLKNATLICKELNVDHVAIELDMNLESLKFATLFLINDIGCKLKTDVECFYPFYESFKHIKEKVVVSGLGDDIYFGLSKKARIYFSDTIDDIEEFKEAKYLKHVKQNEIVTKIANSLGEFELLFPYTTLEMKELFKGKTWKEVNTPKVKQPIIDVVPIEYRKFKFYRFALQKGDSNISENFTKLLHSDWNIKGYKRTDGIYNSIQRGEITK